MHSAGESVVSCLLVGTVFMHLSVKARVPGKGLYIDCSAAFPDCNEGDCNSGVLCWICRDPKTVLVQVQVVLPVELLSL